MQSTSRTVGVGGLQSSSRGWPCNLELITTSSHSFEGGAAKMASSKEPAGAEPEREKKTEVYEDSGEPFKFRWVSVLAVFSTK